MGLGLAGPLVIHPPALSAFPSKCLPMLEIVYEYLCGYLIRVFLPYHHKNLLHENRDSVYFNSFTKVSTVLSILPGT